MHALQPHLDTLADATAWTYGASSRSSSEPAAWTALALAAHGMQDAARRPADWLARLQQSDGSVGESCDQPEPRWATGLAMWAWRAAGDGGGSERYSEQIARAAAWGLSARGKTAPRSAEVGHNTELAGWSWADATHSWLEPTAMFVMGLSAAGYATHDRVLEGVRLIVDRLLPDGGANYGNTIVLGQPLLAHIQPTGLAMMALAGRETSDVRVAKSLDYLARSLGPLTSPASLALGRLGLAAHGRTLNGAEQWIAESLAATDGSRLAVYERALLLLAMAETPLRHVVDVARGSGEQL